MKKTHWTWHLWLLAAGLLLVSMAVFNPIFVERWISPDGHMETDGLNLLAKLRFGAFILAVMCCLFWTFRRRFSQIFVTRYDPQHWQISDWLGFAITFGLLMLYPLLNGYPFIYPDTLEYASGVCSATLRSPTLGCAMWPVIAMTGIWGYVTVQTAITAFSFVLLSKHIFGYMRTSMVSLAILLANVGLFSGWLMADIWTIIGLISLFLIITGYTSPIVGAVLAFSFSVHYANFPVCLSVACIFWVFVRSGRKTILTIFLCFLSGIALVVATNLFVGQFSFASKGTYAWIAGRMLADLPAVLRQKCEDEPDFKLCALESEIFTMSRVETKSLMWYLRGHDKIEREEFDEVLAKELVMYSLLHFPLENTAMAMKNTFSLMSYFPAADGFWPEPDLQQYMPNDLAFQQSWQTTKRLYDSLKKLEVPFTILYWTTLFVCLSAVILGRKNLQGDLSLQLALLALISVVLNALFMANLAGIFGRYHTRILFLPAFAALAVMAQWAGPLKMRSRGVGNVPESVDCTPP